MMHGDVLQPYSKIAEVLCAPKTRLWHQWLQKSISCTQCFELYRKSNRPSRLYRNGATSLFLTNNVIYNSIGVLPIKLWCQLEHNLLLRPNCLWQACDCKTMMNTDYNSASFLRAPRFGPLFGRCVVVCSAGHAQECGANLQGLWIVDSEC